MVLNAIPQMMIVDRMQSFLEPWPTLAKKRGWKVFVAHGQVNPEMIQQMDVIYCNWADPLAAQLSSREWPGRLAIMIRSFEAYAGFLSAINWSNVDLVLYVAPHIRDYVHLNYDIPDDLPEHYVPDCVDVDAFPLKKDLSAGNCVACVGRLGAPKNVQFLVNAAYEFPEYQFCFKGPFDDRRLEPFLAYHQVKSSNIHYEGPSGNDENTWHTGEGVDEFLESCHYIASPSFHEGTHMALLEGMSKGLVPLVQDRPGAVYQTTYLCMSDFGEMLHELKPSESYRQWVIENRSLPRMEAAVDVALDALAPSPIITA